MKNIRTKITDIDDTALRASMKAFGWKKEYPAIQDQDGETVVGHRRLRLAKQLDIEPVIKVQHFKDDAARLELQVVSNIGFAEMTVEDRKKVAQQMATDDPRLTQAEIADVLGVSQKTISQDVGNLYQGINQKPAKTARNPKGAGRPRGGTTKSKAEPKPKPLKEKDPERGRVAGVDVKVEPEIWKIFSEKARKEKKSATIKIAELITADVNPAIELASLSLTAQQKLDLAIKQATRRLEVEIEKRVREENLDWIKRQLDRYNENARHYELIINRRGGIMSRADYRSVLSCLHPDRIQDSDLKRRFGHAFNLFTKLEKAVLNEKESPTKPSDLPKTVDELLKRKAEFQAQKRAMKQTKQSVDIRR